MFEFLWLFIEPVRFRINNCIVIRTDDLLIVSQCILRRSNMLKFNNSLCFVWFIFWRLYKSFAVALSLIKREFSITLSMRRDQTVIEVEHVVHHFSQLILRNHLRLLNSIFSGAGFDPDVFDIFGFANGLKGTIKYIFLGQLINATQLPCKFHIVSVLLRLFGAASKLRGWYLISLILSWYLSFHKYKLIKIIKKL